MIKVQMFVASVLLCLATSNAPRQFDCPSSIDRQCTAATLDQNPVVSTVLSTPTSTNGLATTRYIFLVDDGTGSMDVFGQPLAAAQLPGGYVPVAGDALTISAPNSPFNGIPELGSPTAITKNSSGNPTPACRF